MNKTLANIIRVYKKIVSPVFEKIFGKTCRFTPTCSEFTIEALERFGTIKGLSMSIKRIVRCNPWGGSGFDPI